MKTTRNFLLPIILSFSLAIILTSCGGGSKQDKKSQRDTMTEQSTTKQGYDQNESSDNMHQQHNSLAENFSHKDIVILEQPYNPSEATKAELEQVINAYLQIKNGLVKDDDEAVYKAAYLMTKKVLAVNPEQMESKGLDAWQNHKTLYQDKLKEMQHIAGLKNKRSYFSHISEIMYCTIKSFGLKQGNLFAVYCPMAFNNKGAYWISGNKEIQNPYLGRNMPKCGEIKEEL